MLICDSCGCKSRRPAITVFLDVFCVGCAPRNGMFPGECGPAHSYEDWKTLAAEQQAVDTRWSEHKIGTRERRQGGVT